MAEQNIRLCKRPGEIDMLRSAKLATVFLVLASGQGLAEGDAAKGEKLFARCLACHSVKDAVNKTGPHLKGIVGRPVASIEGFKYSPGMLEFAKTAGAWDETKLDSYLTDPKAFVPKNKMALAPMKKAEERADIIAYLKTITP
jgi:cytochrome c